jgi:acetolactate synthase I/II/III large subunit
MSGQIKASDYIARELADEGVTHVFEVAGGMITHLLDSIYRAQTIRLVSMHHEQAAAFAADGLARTSGIPGVAFATSGPGAVNLLTGIGSCFFDSTPAVFITGQVNRDELKRDRPIRQLGFQETDIVTMAAPVTKAAWTVEDPAELSRMLRDAFTLARAGRPGPVLIDIPMDVQGATIVPTVPGSAGPCREAKPPEPYDVDAVLSALAASQRPLVLAGGGIRAGGAAGVFRSVVAALGVPVVHSLHGVDLLPYRHPMRVGMIGSYGNRWANQALGVADFLLVVGSRLDIRQTGADTDAFSAGKAIFHVDVDSGEINSRVRGCHAVVATGQSFLQSLSAALPLRDLPTRDEWLAEIADLARRRPDTSELHGRVSGINPNRLMHEIGCSSPLAGAFVVDVGQHQMWAAQSLELRADQRFMTSGGMGAMGFALPAAIGSAFALGENAVIVIAGDGGFQLNLQELETVADNSLPIKMIVLNNGTHGMVRQFQETYFAGRYPSTTWGYSAPDFTRVARAYGIGATSIREPGEIERGLAELWDDAAVPFLLEVAIDQRANAYPKLAFGLPITEMEPDAAPIAMEGT